MQRQLRGNLPQAFVHALLLETAAGSTDPATSRRRRPFGCPGRTRETRQQQGRTDGSLAGCRRDRRQRRHRPRHRPGVRGSAGRRVALLARGRAGPRRGRRRRTPRGGRALTVATDTADHEQVDAAARRGRGRARADRRLGQRRVHLGVRAVHRHRARGVPAGHRGDLPRLRQRHPRGTAQDAARATAARSSRSGPRWPTAASRCSRRTAAPSTRSRASTSRCARAAARRQQRARDDGADARGQHAAVLLGAVPAARPGPAGAADLPAGGRRDARSLYAADHPRRREYWVGGSTVATLLANAVAPGPLDRYLARTGFSSPADRPGQGPRPAGQPLEAGRRPRRPRLRRARAVRRPLASRARPQLWASQHHGLLAAAAVAAGARGSRLASREGRKAS